ncbi:uncharacterized protein LOC130647694 isoform X1 [Hydractinia symbiolongicarpus]|uniref:uncharacterized protein LOC130647694 isoform X1 n=1 Tax=Hydractinia symbiolongicarpus TaxID=13093 RepID=UPI0025518CCB|nr:uncharacterized protein LOC130647694 isoform X1 [Hydractinia symbiolongicarpus]
MACRQGRRKRAKIDHNEVAVAHVTKGVDQDGLRKYYINKEIGMLSITKNHTFLNAKNNYLMRTNYLRNKFLRTIFLRMSSPQILHFAEYIFAELIFAELIFVKYEEIKRKMV